MVEKINAIRKKEMKNLETNAYLRGATRAYMGAVPGITSVVSFLFCKLLSFIWLKKRSSEYHLILLEVKTDWSGFAT